jgi:hypothetical protein
MFVKFPGRGNAAYCVFKLSIFEETDRQTDRTTFYNWSRWSRRSVACALLGYYTAYSRSSLPTFRDSTSVLSSRVSKWISWPLKIQSDRLSRNVGKELPLHAAWYPRRAQISSTPWRKPEFTQLGCVSAESSVDDLGVCVAMTAQIDVSHRQRHFQNSPSWDVFRQNPVLMI